MELSLKNSSTVKEIHLPNEKLSQIIILLYRSCHSICIHGNGMLAIFMLMFYTHLKIILLMGTVICEYRWG